MSPRSWESRLSRRASCAGAGALRWLLLSEWPSLLLIYSSLYTRSSGSLLMFTSTGDIGLLILTIILQFMVMRIGRCTVLYHTSERGCTKRDRLHQLDLIIIFVLDLSTMRLIATLYNFYLEGRDTY